MQISGAIAHGPVWDGVSVEMYGILVLAFLILGFVFGADGLSDDEADELRDAEFLLGGDAFPALVFGGGEGDDDSFGLDEWGVCFGHCGLAP